MPRYLFQSSYTAEGVRGLLKEGGSSRVAYLRTLTESLGGKLEAFYWAFGETDTYLIAECPSNESAAALSLAASASGTGRVKTVVLLTPEEIDAAAKQEVGFRPPGA
jgi:uncharacterized protein with GYD domain